MSLGSHYSPPLKRLQCAHFDVGLPLNYDLSTTCFLDSIKAVPLLQMDLDCASALVRHTESSPEDSKAGWYPFTESPFVPCAEAVDRMEKISSEPACLLLIVSELRVSECLEAGGSAQGWLFTHSLSIRSVPKTALLLFLQLTQRLDPV